jgi:large subunit ribosomal protein L18
MDILKKKALRKQRIKKGIRKNLSGTSDRPRLTVFRSNKEIYAQLIDDINGQTIIAASSIEEDLKGSYSNKIEQAVKVGATLAERAKNANIASVIFDRNGYLYHGRVKALADAAREGGLNF